MGMKLPAELSKKLRRLAAEYRWPALILLLGLVLLLWPSGKQTQTPAPAAPPADDYCARTEQRLEQILSRIDGAGRVRVMLTLRSGQAVQYQTDLESVSRNEGESGSLSTVQKTVILSREGAYNEAAVVKTEYPRFQGALIVSQGGDDAAVRFQLSSAVSALLGLGADQITVVKMK